MVRSIEYLDSMLNSERYRWNVQALSGQDIAAMAHAARALAVYDARVFRPADPENLPPAKKAKTPSRSSPPPAGRPAHR